MKSSIKLGLLFCSFYGTTMDAMEKQDQIAKQFEVVFYKGDRSAGAFDLTQIIAFLKVKGMSAIFSNTVPALAENRLAIPIFFMGARAPDSCTYDTSALKLLIENFHRKNDFMLSQLAKGMPTVLVIFDDSESAIKQSSTDFSAQYEILVERIRTLARLRSRTVSFAEIDGKPLPEDLTQLMKNNGLRYTIDQDETRVQDVLVFANWIPSIASLKECGVLVFPCIVILTDKAEAVKNWQRLVPYQGVKNIVVVEKESFLRDSSHIITLLLNNLKAA